MEARSPTTCGELETQEKQVVRIRSSLKVWEPGRAPGTSLDDQKNRTVIWRQKEKTEGHISREQILFSLLFYSGLKALDDTTTMGEMDF